MIRAPFGPKDLCAMSRLQGRSGTISAGTGCPAAGTPSAKRLSYERVMWMKNTNSLGFCLSLVALALLAACAAPSQTRLPDGSLAIRIVCDGTAGGLNYCFERAGKSCGATGYSIVDNTGRVLSGSRVADSDMEALVRAFETDQNSILVKCNN